MDLYDLVIGTEFNVIGNADGEVLFYHPTEEEFITLASGADGNDIYDMIQWGELQRYQDVTVTAIDFTVTDGIGKVQIYLDTDEAYSIYEREVTGL